MDNLCAWTGRGIIDLLGAMRDRREWRAIVAEAWAWPLNEGTNDADRTEPNDGGGIGRRTLSVL